MPKASFSHVKHWVFDLDNTLYPSHMQLFDQISPRMTAYVERTLGVSQGEADQLRAQYWRDHGSTLAGLIQHHDIDPDPYLVEVHDVSMDRLDPDPALAGAIAALPGRKTVYTNGTEPYAQRVLKARGLDGVFEAVYGVEHAGYQSKPSKAAFETVLTLAGIETETAAMFEDDPRNLEIPHALGMRTVHVAEEPAKGAHIHHHTDDLGAFLCALR